jgi:hypothetical protein
LRFTKIDDPHEKHFLQIKSSSGNLYLGLFLFQVEGIDFASAGETIIKLFRIFCTDGIERRLDEDG